MKLKAIVLFLFFSILTFGQSPEKFTYQSIIKNSSGYLLKNQEVGLRISILFNSSNGAEVYSEEHFPTSNSNGLVTVIIGEGLTGDNISDIDWGNGEYFIKVEVDPEGGINYTMNQTSQLLSVPYALYAENSGSGINLLGQDFITLSNQTLTVNKVDLVDDVDGILPIANGGTGSGTAPMVGLITAADVASARAILGLGTAAITASTDYATAAQGALADTALQDATAFATAAQGALADTALQDATAFATATQGTKADGALQAANDLSDLNDAATARTNLGLGTAAVTASTDYLSNAAKLSIAAGSGAGDVAISSETLRIVGTLNEIETIGSNQTITIGLPSSISVNLVGDVTGTATLASTVTVSDETSNTDFPIVFNDESNGLLDDTGSFVYNPSTGALTSSAFVGNLTGDVTGNVSGSSGSTTGNAATATALNTTTDGIVKTTGGDGTLSIGVLVSGDIPNNAADTSGNAATATALETARNIGGVSFDGTADINLPGVNTTGDQNTTGNAATATLASTVSINTSTIDADAAPLGSSYSSTAVIGIGSRTFSTGANNRNFYAGIDLSSTSSVTITPTQTAYGTFGPSTYNLQLVVFLDHNTDTFTVTCYVANSAVQPDVDFTFNFIAIK